MTVISERLRSLGTCAVSDALDTLGMPGATTGIRPLWQVKSPVAGSVRTVLAAAKSGTAPGRHIAADAVATAAGGEVLVIANAGRTDVSCWGGILTVAAVRRGIAAVLVDGAVRDIAESEEAGLPVFGRAVVPVSARNRIVQRAMDVPVSFAGVTVQPGSWVVADRNGAVFVTGDGIHRVIGLAEQIADREAQMMGAIGAGQPVADVMHDSRFPGADTR